MPPPSPQPFARHVLRLAGSVLLLVLAVIYPFLPGSYDPLAATISHIIQVLTVLGLLCVPGSVAWLLYEKRKQRQERRQLPFKKRAFGFALASVLPGLLPMMGAFLIAVTSIGFSLALPLLALVLYCGTKLIGHLRQLIRAESSTFNVLPAYLTVIPISLSLAQFFLAGPLTDSSRQRAMNAAAPILQQIEQYHASHGRYPISMLGLHRDYSTSVIGIECFHYGPFGDAYNLYFEQPRFYFDRLGTREVVVFNKLDQHLISSHAAWQIEWAPQQLLANQGWYAAHPSGQPNWKSFWFD